MDNKKFLNDTKNLTKLSSDQLNEIHQRLISILKNKKIISGLPDKGLQLNSKFDAVKREIQHREDVKTIHTEMENLTVSSRDLKTTHVQHICAVEKLSVKERYKPSLATDKDISKVEKHSQLIPLAESITLLTQQTIKLPVESSVEEITEEEEKDHEEC